MKTLFTIIFLMVGSAFVYLPPCPTDTPYSDIAYDMLKNLDKSQIPTGALYENVFPFADVETFDGSASTDTSNSNHFLQAYSELYLSKFNNTGLTHFFDVETAVESFNPDRQFHHPMGIIDFEFNTISPEAVNNNLLTVSNNQLFDVADRTQSPYIYHKAQVASPLMGEDYPYFYAGTHYLHFSDSFVLSNTGFNLSQIDFLEVKLNGNAIFSQSVSGLSNFVLPLTISNIDQKMALEMTFTANGTTKKYNIASYQVAQVATTACEGQDQFGVEGYAFDGGYGKGLSKEFGVATIYYANQNCESKKLHKVIIFVDGFDANNKQHHDKIWKEYLNKEFGENGGTSQLGTELRSSQHNFDIVILDQVKTAKYNSGGAGLVENNGLVLAKLLETLYELHSTTLEQDFIVVGASMGGLVSRYGLAWMEHNNKPHHTRLFISFDSPQMGAEIPIGLQHTVDKFTQFGGLASFASVRNALHQSDAAQQMLVWHSFTNSESVEPHPRRNILLNNLAAVGNYPSQCRMISISNGNRIGTLKSIQPAQPDVPAINEKDLEADFGIKRRVLFFCNSNLCYKLHTRIYAQTASNRNRTNEFVINSVNLLLLVLGPTQLPFMNTTKYAVSENGTSYDIAPGSRLRQDPLKKAEGLGAALLAFAFVGPIAISTNNLKHTNFIPTVSSVAYTFPNNEPFNIYKNFNGVNLSKCAGTTPFDTVYAFNTDLPHVDIDQNIANAFRYEVYNILPKSVCTAPCPEFIISSSQIPNNTNETYKASKYICLIPGFTANGSAGTVFKAQIGCMNLMNPTQIKILPVKPLVDCPFEFDQAKNQLICGAGITTFKVFIKNLDVETYSEFSTDGINWYRASIGDKGWSVTLNTNSGQVQQFFARPHNNPSGAIQGFLSYCN